MSNFWGHLCTVNRHRRIVRQLCFKVGLYKNGLLHDLSKYSPEEFLTGVKYFKGDFSPNSAERRDKGYSKAWLHHKGRNLHHMEYWIDYAMNDEKKLCGLEMPVKYVVEMFFDRVSACIVYQGEKYTDQSPYDYFIKTKDYCVAHPNTLELLEKLLVMLKDSGMANTVEYIKSDIL